MWTDRYPSTLMLVRVRTASRGLTVPLPLVILDQLFEALADLAWLAGLIPGVRRRLGERWRAVPGIEGRISDPAKLLEGCRALMRELRRYGRWQLVDVRSGEDRVTVEMF